MENVAARDAEAALEIQRCQHLPLDNKAAKSGRVVLDDVAGDGMPGRSGGQGVHVEPARVLQLIAVDDDVAARIAGDEPDHELARKGPVLAADVRDVLHVDADLFLHLARHAALERLAVVDEAGHERVAAGRKGRLAREQHPVAVAHEHDHARMQVRVVLVAAPRAFLAPLALDARGGGAAARAVAARALPVQRLHRHAAQGQQLIAQRGAAHGNERLAAQARRHRRLGGQHRDPARHVAERAQPEGLGARAARGQRALRQARRVGVGGDEQMLILHDEPVSEPLRRLRAALGGREGAAQTVAVEGQVHRLRRHALLRGR